MANQKTGLLYYNADTDRFQDIRIKRLKKAMGCDGYAVYEYLLNEIYRVRGCFLVWDESTAFDAAEYWGLKETKVNEIVRYCCAVGLFDKALLDSGRVLTSPSIQSRYVSMCIRARRKAVDIPETYNILPEESRKMLQEYLKLAEVSPKMQEESPKLTEESGKMREESAEMQEESTKMQEETAEMQEVCRKVKYSKVKESKEKESKEKASLPYGREKKDAAAAATLARREAFYASLVPYVDLYGRDMVRDFFDYWSELSRSRTQMRFEKQPTWELARRLATWAKREKTDGRKQDTAADPARDGRQRRLDSAVAVATRVREAAARRRRELESQGVDDPLP